MVKDFRMQRHLKAAERYYAEKKYKEAIIEYRSGLRFDPQNMAAVKKLGLAYYENGQFGEAFALLRRVTDDNPNDLESRQKVGTLYLMGRANDKARARGRGHPRAEARRPRRAAALRRRRGDARADRTTRSTRLETKRATLGDPDRVARALGVLYARSKDLPRAEQEFKAAVTSKPDSPEAHSALAQLHLGKGELAEAEKEFKAAADLAPAGSRARLQLADFYLLTRRVEDAKKVLGEITTQAPDAFPAWLRLAEIAFAEGKLDDAQKAIDPVLKADKDNAGAHIIQTRIHLAKHDAAKAVASATAATKAEPRNALAFHTLALAQVAAGNPAARPDRGQGRGGAAAACSRTPCCSRRSCSMQAGDTVGAVAALKNYLEKQPKDPRAWEALGTALLRTRDAAGALASYTKATELAPTVARGPFLMGVALRALGQEGRGAAAVRAGARDGRPATRSPSRSSRR